MTSPTARETLLRWLLAFGCFAVLLFFFSPSWVAFSIWSRVPEFGAILEVRRGVSVLAQAAHPGAPIADPLHAVIQWRLLFPLLGYAFNLPPILLFSLAHVGALVVLAYLITVLRARATAWIDTALGTLALGAASWFFVSTGWLGYFDSWLALGLLLVAFSPSPAMVWGACVLAPWVDERFVLAAPLALACRWFIRFRLDGAALRWRSEVVIPAVLLGAFVVVRLGVLSSHSSSNATLGGYMSVRNYLDAPPSRMLLGIWEGLRGGWLFVIAGLWLVRPRVAAVAAVVVMVAFIVAGLATAQDYSRSMTALLPVAVLGLLLVLQEKGYDARAETAGNGVPALPSKGEGSVGAGLRSAPVWGVARPWRARFLTVTAAAALLLPAHHVMNDRTTSIYYLYHELAALDSPPPAAMPELHELNAIHLMEQGEFGAAEAQLTLAIKLARNPAAPARQRGVLYASTQRWEEARRDFTTVVENDPENPDGWFLRAQVQLALRQPSAARADFDHARSIAPKGWSDRSDVARFAKTLNQQAPAR